MSGHSCESLSRHLCLIGSLLLLHGIWESSLGHRLTQNTPLHIESSDWIGIFHLTQKFIDACKLWSKLGSYN